jgi:hypothetical protein
LLVNAATASGCSAARERVRGWRGSLGSDDAPQRLARSLKTGVRPTRTPQAMVPSLVGMVFTPACALALRGGQRPAGRRHGLQVQGPVGEGLVAIDLPADIHAGTAKWAL